MLYKGSKGTFQSLHCNGESLNTLLQSPLERGPTLGPSHIKQLLDILHCVWDATGHELPRAPSVMIGQKGSCYQRHATFQHNPALPYLNPAFASVTCAFGPQGDNALQWPYVVCRYAENQQLLSANDALVQQQAELILQLKERLAAAEGPLGMSHKTRIKELEQQVWPGGRGGLGRGSAYVLVVVARPFV